MSQYVRILHKKTTRRDYFVIYFIELCSYIIENVFSNVQTREIHRFTQAHGEFQLASICELRFRLDGCSSAVGAVWWCVHHHRNKFDRKIICVCSHDSLSVDPPPAAWSLYCTRAVSERQRAASPCVCLCVWCQVSSHWIQHSPETPGLPSPLGNIVV